MLTEERACVPEEAKNKSVTRDDCISLYVSSRLQRTIIHGVNVL